MKNVKKIFFIPVPNITTNEDRLTEESRNEIETWVKTLSPHLNKKTQILSSEALAATEIVDMFQGFFSSPVDFINELNDGSCSCFDDEKNENKAEDLLNTMKEYNDDGIEVLIFITHLEQIHAYYPWLYEKITGHNYDYWDIATKPSLIDVENQSFLINDPAVKKQVA